MPPEDDVNVDHTDGDGDEWRRLVHTDVYGHDMRRFRAILLCLFCHGDHIPEALLERLQSAVKHTFFPDDPYPDTPLYTRHVADHIGAVYDTVNDILTNEPLRNAVPRLNVNNGNKRYWKRNPTVADVTEEHKAFVHNFYARDYDLLAPIFSWET